MTLGFADLLIAVLVLFALHGLWRGVAAIALTTGALFFAAVVVVFSGSMVVDFFRRVGLPLGTADTQALFEAGLFIFTAFMASRVLVSLVKPPIRALARSHRLGGLGLGLLNAFVVMAFIEHYLSIVAATVPRTSTVSVGMPDLSFTHPTPNTWSISLVPSTFTLLPPAANTDLWAKLPVALVLLLILLAFIFAGTLYTRLRRVVSD